MNFHSPDAQAELAAYNASMEKSLEDKLFFLEHTAGATTFVDFGCANGAVLKAISERRKGKTLIGIDINPVQLAIASQKVPGGVFVEDFELVREMVAKADGPKVAIFSSVLHESPRIVRAAIGGVFDYVIIRDMAISSSVEEMPAPEKWVDAICAADGPAMESWLRADRVISTMGELTEFLLKAPYLGHSEAQTKRELAENYPMKEVERLADGPERNYASLFFQHYSAPWIVERIRHDFGFEFPFPTHFKLILKKVAV